MSYTDTPVFINNFNNCSRGFSRLVDWLVVAGMTDITVIDNCSKWPPLLNYYDDATAQPRPPFQLLRMPTNLGHDAFWKIGIKTPGRFILTDPDVVPDAACPLNLIERMHEVSDRYAPAKVGPGIRIDNLPDRYHLKDLMLRSEGDYWHPRRQTPDGSGYFAPIDTTFALYEKGAGKWDGEHVRLAEPYVVEHIPWYLDSSVPHTEREFYKATVLPGISHSQ